MTENEQEIKKKIRVENKRTSKNLNRVTVGSSFKKSLLCKNSRS